MSHGHGGRKAKKHHEEEHENHERWLVSYADMMTLLMVLFIVMFAISAVDQRKFAQLKTGLADGFSAPQSVTEGGSGPLDQAGTDAQIVERESVKTANDTLSKSILQKAEVRVKTEQQADDREKERKEAEDFKKLEAKLQAELKKQGILNKVKFTIDERGLVVTIITDKVIFLPDRAVLQPTGVKIIAAIAPSLRKVANNISVEGHTSTEKVQTRFFPSDWALSGERASAVVDYMVTRLGFDEARISERGWGHTRPAYAGSSERSNSLNRRVEIIVTSGLHPVPGQSAASAPAEPVAPVAADVPDSVIGAVAGPGSAAPGDVAPSVTEKN